ncbi:LOW QUALITY PROTEIN: uncharacterized protein B0I36DRAFT_374964 [Microdochium trichocladiopsis]|uniref:ML-like domain-containing protein n=1 Tax=Microdochium trichocladiopsis TaxID=1682393 RepID=A0A9P8Y4Y5_9PEZI|nr:LOW QUALITY PROTEIN: uncharacterized protein B0I36DRAFT_374964 [Microdochium trichocladiopsis]KAH7029449.1 LOW QUALITY PROTEIN: hypothetical protein B0I36DRAFT_374964 [Microdochium trichocladiopsis]
MRYHYPNDSVADQAILPRGAGLLPYISAQTIDYVNGTSVDGYANDQLAPDRTPTLYTGDFGDCLGGESLLNITNFDAALYWDNATILLHLDGRTNIRSEEVMLHFSLDTYGESRFSKIIDPCQNGMTSLCPMRASQTIGAAGVFPVTADQVSAFPPMTFSMPDVEGLARVQIFANSSKTEIACFQASLKNGKTFSQPAAVGSTLAVFTIVAIIASFATAAYGVSIVHMRTHYAHSLSVLVIFETFQSIFLTGALSLRWPTILPAWWSNFAWASGLIPSPEIVSSVNSFAGVSGNASQVGGAGSTVLNNNGGLTQLIYGRASWMGMSIGPVGSYNDAWNGAPVRPGLPLPGDSWGFPETLSPLAFVVALIWTLVAIALVLFCSVVFKAALEGMWLKQDRLQFYRTGWLRYLAIAILRASLMAVFPISTLALYEFATGDGASAVAVAAVVFVIFLAGTCFLVWHALHARFQNGKFALATDRILLRPARLFRVIPFIAPVRLSQLKESEFATKPRGSLPFLRLHFIDENPSRRNAHQDEPYIMRHGWLSARYRISRWWFFACWAAYQLVRACFLGGAAANPLAQVFGLFLVEVLAFVIRNTALAVWLLGLAKVLTTGMSIAFLPDFDLNRIVTTVIGALLTTAVVVLIIIGCISTWMSLYRNKEYFVTDKLDDLRIRYYDHMAEAAKDEKKPSYKRRSKPKSTYMVNSMATGKQPEATPEQPIDMMNLPLPPPMSRHHKTTHSFSVSHVRRLSKIEDEDDEPVDEIKPVAFPPAIRNSQLRGGTRSRTTSVSSIHSASSLPRGARPHRVSWSSYDFTAGRQERRPSSAIVAAQLEPTVAMPSESGSSTAQGRNEPGPEFDLVPTTASPTDTSPVSPATPPELEKPLPPAPEQTETPAAEDEAVHGENLENAPRSSTEQQQLQAEREALGPPVA